MTWAIRPLSDGHQRGEFSCGVEQLDRYIRAYAGQHERKNFGRTFVAVLEDSDHVVGYYTLCTSSVAFEHVPERLSRKLPRYPIPTVLIGKLAVDRSARGQGLGAVLLFDALKRIYGISNQLGVLAVEVYAIDERARSFYAQYGFQSFRDERAHLFLFVETVQTLLK